MKEFIPERALIVQRGKEIQIIALGNGRLYTCWNPVNDMDAKREFERRRLNARKDKNCKVEIIHTLKEKKNIGEFLNPVRDFYYKKIMGQKVRLRKEE